MQVALVVGGCALVAAMSAGFAPDEARAQGAAPPGARIDRTPGVRIDRTPGVRIDRTPGVRIDPDDIGGVVTGPSGPEAGVWVIAETRDTPTRFAKVVVTDDRGRFLVPDLPKGRYDVWVRGYGLVDSPKTSATPGTLVNLTAVTAKTPAEAAQGYPAMYWFSMLRVPEAQEFPLGPVTSQGQWLNTVKSGACQSCHALGTPGMRKVPDEFMKIGSSHEAWRRRLQSGGAMSLMARDIGRLDGERAIRHFAEWTDGIAKGALPFAKPERPTGISRNAVVTLWDWSRPTAYLHDIVSTDRRNPRLNANGLLYASPEDSTDLVPELDPRTNKVREILHPVRDPQTPSSKGAPFQPSAVWGAEPIWDSKTLNHNPMFDGKGRVWFTSRVRPNRNPDWCKDGSNPSSKAFPLAGEANRHLGMYDPKADKWTLISTCFPTHHLNFASDRDETLWLSAGVVSPGVVGWLNTRMYEQTGDEVKSQGWTPLVVDTNGNGKRDPWQDVGKPFDATKDTRIALTLYAIAVAPSDGAVWGTAIGYPGQIVRVAPGSDPVNTAMTEVYEPPSPGFGPRGGDVDLNGVYWVALASGHLGEFDRRKCGTLKGPKAATGQHCPEGWTLHTLPGPQLRDVKTAGSAEASYYVWVDWFGILGLGKNVPIAMGNLSDTILAFVNGKFVPIHIPYPQGIFAKNVDGRIDDPAAGWKGRGIWTTSGSRTHFHNEDGKASMPRAVKVQMRPHPLAN